VYPMLFPEVDPRSIKAVEEIIALMPSAAMYGLHSQETSDSPDTSAIMARTFTSDMLNKGDFIGRITWRVSRDQLPMASADRYLLLEIVPEGIAVTHHLPIYGKTVIGLPGMPTGKDSAATPDSPKVEYCTVAEEEFVKKILERLRRK
jgi:hypothetical protein